MTPGDDTIKIEAASRWDALDLARRLSGFRTHLVQLSDRRWIVCVRQDRDLDALTVDVLGEVERWVTDRRIEATLQLGGRSYALHA